MSLPPGFYMPNQVLRLRKALYGLRQLLRLWWKHLSKILGKFGLQLVSNKICLFTNEWLIVFFYIDDIVVLYHKRDQEKFNAFDDFINKEFKLRDLHEITWFLGVRIIRDRNAKKL